MQFDIGSIPNRPWSSVAAGEIVEIAKAVEAAGADRLGISEMRHTHDCLTLMAACLMATRRLRVESQVTDPFTRHPFLTARAVATLSDLSGGRALLGLGGGVEQPSYWGEDRSKPLTALREGVEVIRAAWHGEKVDFEGKLFELHGARLKFPIKYRIPIIIAARSPRALELAGEIGDIVLMGSFFTDKESYVESLEHVKVGLERSGRRIRDIEVDISVPSCVCDDGEKAVESSKPFAAMGIMWASGRDVQAKKNYKHWDSPSQFSVPDAVVSALERWDYWGEKPLPGELASLLDRDTVDKFTASGTPEEVARRFRRLMSYPDVGGLRVVFIPVKGESYLAGSRETIAGLGKVFAMTKGKGP